MKKHLPITGGFLVGLLTLGGPGRAEDLYTKDLDVKLRTDVGEAIVRPLGSGGDFNGDGVADIVVGERLGEAPLRTRAQLVLGGSLPREAPVTAAMRVRGPDLLDRAFFLDINGDGLDDLGLEGDWQSGGGSSVHIFFGRADPPAEIDLTTTPADLTVTYPLEIRDLAWGDFNGDGIDDLALGSGVGATVHLVLGRPVFSSSTIDLSVGSSVLFLKTPGWLGTSVSAGDINGDGFSDLILSDNQADPGGRTNAGEVYVIWGRTVFPTTWNLSTTPPDITVRGKESFSNLRCRATGDVDGDGKSDLLFFDSVSPLGVFLLTAEVLMSAPLPIDLSVGIPGHTPPSLPGVEPDSEATARMGDFDGDGLADILYQRDGDPLALFLSSDFLGASPFPPPAVRFLNSRHMDLGDVNDDGRLDLVVSPVDLPSGSAGVIYGHRPLDKPVLTWNGWDPAAPRALLGLAVEGQPTEMRLSGDLADSFRDQWIPFQPFLTVTFTSSAGTKTLTALFRNSFGRQSPPVALSVPLDPGAPGVKTVTNLLEAPGQMAVVHCTLDHPARVTAAVFDQTGTLLVQLLDGDLGPGVWPLAWDGANASGKAVPPGVYFLSVKIDGQINRRKILVR